MLWLGQWNNYMLKELILDEHIHLVIELINKVYRFQQNKNSFFHQHLKIHDAIAWTMEQNFSGKEMNYVFQNVIHFAKNMRNTYSMNDHPLSYQLV